MKLKLEYTLSDEDTDKVRKALLRELNLIKKCDEWRRKNGIRHLKYEIIRSL